MLKLIQRCGNAYREFKSYNIRDCIALLESLPVKLQEGAWCLSLLGRCYYELANYRLVRREPIRADRALLTVPPISTGSGDIRTLV